MTNFVTYEKKKHRKIDQLPGIPVLRSDQNQGGKINKTFKDGGHIPTTFVTMRYPLSAKTVFRLNFWYYFRPGSANRIAEFRGVLLKCISMAISIIFRANDYEASGNQQVTHSSCSTWLGVSFCDKPWLSYIILRTSGSASLKQNAKRMKEYLLTLYSHQKPSHCISVEQPLQNKLNGRDQRYNYLS